ncbi:hypothetical protein LUZ60_000179 [Juncus effusus]|nr:hypothetical protein LUZ60_000179 [Juncus effusus]
MSSSKNFFSGLKSSFKSRSRSRSSGGGSNNEEQNVEVMIAIDDRVFRYETLVTATRNFSYKLGEGGFGPVFKGVVPDGREVAVKKLALNSSQGEKQFANEVIVLSRLQHTNVVHLYGYCIHGSERLLVYEYVTNQSLQKLLFPSESSSRHVTLSWQQRYGVMVDVAQGLLYLHKGAQTPIIHRDIKAGNILLDENWVAKIADFGMARLFSEAATHVSSQLAGTDGYMAPEYLMNGYLSPMADVYSYGVILLELITGKKCISVTLLPGDETRVLVEWAWKLYAEKKQPLEMLDPVLRSTANLDQVMMCTKIALLCTQSDPSLRPDMKRVGLLFSRGSSIKEEPSRPAFVGYWLPNPYPNNSNDYSDESDESNGGSPFHLNLSNSKSRR